MKIGKTLTDANISELSAISGFTAEQVREWHAGFLVSRIEFLCLSLTNSLCFLSERLSNGKIKQKEIR